jgi:alpha-D-ribose 1-methylphosphonate 5-triphosphate synthase subunit PhnH
MARPGTLQVAWSNPSHTTSAADTSAAAIALTLFDYDTPVWLDKQLAQSESVKAFLRFHTGAPIVSGPVEAAFALIADPANMLPLASFNQGSAEYPDTSTTLILTGQNLNNTDGVVLEGPGIKDTHDV